MEVKQKAPVTPMKIIIAALSVLSGVFLLMGKSPRVSALLYLAAAAVAFFLYGFYANLVIHGILYIVMACVLLIIASRAKKKMEEE